MGAKDMLRKLKENILFGKAEFHTSLRKKTMFLMLGLLAVFTLVFVISFSVVMRRTNNDFRTRSSETAVNNVVSTLGSAVDTYNYISRLIMVNERVVSFLHSEEANKSMSYEARMGMYEILNMYGDITYIESMYIFRLDGEYANTGKGEYFIDTDSPEWERILEARGGWVISVSGNGMMKKTGEKPFLMFARAIYDIYTQKRIGVFVMNISNSSFDEIMALQKNSEICILDERGTYLCGNPEVGALYQESFNSEELVSKNIRFHGKACSIAGKRALNSLVVLCCTSTKATVLPVHTLLAMLLILTAFLLSTILYAVFIRSEITKPILMLDKAMERTKSSGWLERIEEKMPENEIGRLAESYNSMIDYLNELFERLLKEEENIRSAEMRVLQEQIKPHFLYNTLETISYIAMQENAQDAYNALETLGSFYRNFLSKGNREINFEKELRITKDYLSLQKLRYGDSFTDEYDIDDRVLDCMVPKLILQPLVENCIYHGVRPKGELCRIRITAKLMKDELHVWVYDTGVGMSEEQIGRIMASEKQTEEQEPASVQGGFGLEGTIERIRYYCNERDIVNIRSVVGEYTEIELRIPNKVQKDEGKGV
ncbi:MAG: sensor histidine kinase [Acetatifactor sp.]